MENSPVSLIVAVVALLVAAAALAVALVRRARAPAKHVHAMEVVQLSCDAEAGLAVFDLRCAVCGATHQRVVDASAVERLAKSVGCTVDEARIALMNACGDAIVAERQIVSG